MKDPLFANNHVFSEQALDVCSASHVILISTLVPQVKDDLREFLSKRRKKVRDLCSCRKIVVGFDSHVKVLGAVKAIARMETIANFKFFRVSLALSAPMHPIDSWGSGSERSYTARG
mmetsp:Transcript_10695/g.35815  ORF Transcript_10695/g.35815 Transcript_10695/m.35815 type:complete len:117 (+) Transcript_10695:1042-1392(+)